MIQVISGVFRHRQLILPKGTHTRPTTSQVRQAVFNICQNEVEDACFLDICAGSGSMGIEAISRGSASCTFIEKEPHALTAIRQNIKNLGLEASTHIMAQDALIALKLLEKQNKTYSLCYFDPPYSQKGQNSLLTESVLTFLDRSSLLAPNATLFMEESKYFTLETMSLSRLTLKNTRRFGDSYLLHFISATDKVITQ